MTIFFIASIFLLQIYKIIPHQPNLSRQKVHLSIIIRIFAARMNKEMDWHWQKEGTAWKGIGIYHVTLTIPSREPLLGTLVVPDNDPSQARVDSTELGRALLDCQRSVPVFHPEIQILQYCLMPDHLHSIWYVRRPMKESIRQAVQGFWRVAKKMGRAYTYLNTRTRQTGGTTNETIIPLSSISPADSRETPLCSISLSSISPADSRDTPLRALLGNDAYAQLAPSLPRCPSFAPCRAEASCKP